MVGLDLYFIKTNKNNKYIFYPFGPLKTGFLVDDSIRKILKEFNKMYTLILTVVLLMLFSTYKNGIILSIPITTLFFMGILLGVIITRITVIKCPKSNLKISFKERKTALLEEYGPKKSIYFLIYSTVFLYLSIYFIFKYKVNGFALILSLIATIYYLMSFINNIALIKASYFE